MKEIEHVGKKWLNCGGVGALKVGGLVGSLLGEMNVRARDP